MFRRTLVALTASLLLGVAVGAPAPATAAPAWQTTSSSWENPRARQPLVIKLRYAQHATFDRVVIDIQGRLPGYTTRYAARHFYDGSGAPVPIRGGMGIALNPAYAHFDNGTMAYSGPKLVRPGFPALKAIAFTGDFEGYVSFSFGLKCKDTTRAPHRVIRLHDPQRIVVDFKHC